MNWSVFQTLFGWILVADLSQNIDRNTKNNIYPTKKIAIYGTKALEKIVQQQKMKSCQID